MRIILAAAALVLSSCAGAPVVTAAPSSCATLLPPEWKQGVAGAELPDGNTVGDWIASGCCEPIPGSVAGRTEA